MKGCMQLQLFGGYTRGWIAIIEDDHLTIMVGGLGDGCGRHGRQGQDLGLGSVSVSGR